MPKLLTPPDDELGINVPVCQNYTSTAHSPQHTVKTLTQVEAKVEDGDCETRREDGDLPFPNSNPCIIIGH
jgi:hypothetical protein